jgi:hypothetical protein
MRASGIFRMLRCGESTRGIAYTNPCAASYSFEPWLSRVETKIGASALDEIQSEIPPEWYDDDSDALNKMVEQLWRRRRLVRELILATQKSSAQPFPNWK